MATKGTLDEKRIVFLRGVLAALASSGQVVHYDEIRRLCRLNQEQVGEYLDAARSGLLDAEQPDFCAIVVNDRGWPGDGWAKDGKGTNPEEWAIELRRSHLYWQDRRAMDNGPFENKYKSLPTFPGLS